MLFGNTGADHFYLMIFPRLLNNWLGWESDSELILYCLEWVVEMSIAISVPYQEVNISNKFFSKELLVIAHYLFYKSNSNYCLSLYKRKLAQQLFSEDILSDRFINGTQYKLVLEEKYNFTL